jgi:hypothetical protein
VVLGALAGGGGAARGGGARAGKRGWRRGLGRALQGARAQALGSLIGARAGGALAGAAAPWPAWPMGHGGPGWAGAGAGGLGRASGPAQSGRIGFFFQNLIPVRKIIQKNSVNYFKARKILRKSQKFQENS